MSFESPFQRRSGEGAVKRPKDFFSGLIFIAIALLVIWISRDYRVGTASRMGPGYFPMLLSGILIVLGAIMLVRSIRGDREQLEAVNLKPLLLILVACVLFGVLIRPAGLLAAVAVTVGVSSFANPDVRPAGVALLAGILALGCVGLFVFGLGQPIPVIGDWFSR